MVLTLCGSNRFEPWFRIWNEVLTLAGHAVFTTAVYPSFKEGVKNWYTDAEKEILDEVHKRKITASSGIVVINPMGYIGESTQREIAHALMGGKKVWCLESWARGKGIGPDHRDDWREAAKAWGIPEGYVSPVSTAEFYDAYNLLGMRRELVAKIQAVTNVAMGIKEEEAA